MPPTSANSRGREHRRTHLGVVAGQAPSTRALRDAPDVQVRALQAVGDDAAPTTSGKQPSSPSASVNDAADSRRSATTGVSATGSHIILLPKLARSCSRKTSSAGDDRADRGDAGERPFEPAVLDVADHAVEQCVRLEPHRRRRAHDRSSEILSRKIVDAIVALCGWPRRNACANFFACS